MSGLDELRRLVDAKREEYARALPGRVGALVARCRGPAAMTDEDRGVAAREAHNLAGTGGTLGFRALAAAARDVEIALERRDSTAVAAALERLLACVERPA